MLCFEARERERGGGEGAGEFTWLQNSYPPRWGSAFSLFTAKCDNSVDDGVPVPKRDIERNHSNRAVAILVHGQLSIIGKIRGSRPGIRDILLPVKWRLEVSVYANRSVVQEVARCFCSSVEVLTRRSKIGRFSIGVTNEKLLRTSRFHTRLRRLRLSKHL